MAHTQPDFIHVPARMSRRLVPAVNRRRIQEGHSWTFLVAKLLELYIERGEEIWKAPAKKRAS